MSDFFFFSFVLPPSLVDFAAVSVCMEAFLESFRFKQPPSPPPSPSAPSSTPVFSLVAAAVVVSRDAACCCSCDSTSSGSCRGAVMMSGKVIWAPPAEAGRRGGDGANGVALGEWFCTLPWNRGSLLLLLVAVLVLADGGLVAVWGGLVGACLVDTLTSLPHDMLAPLAVRCTCDPSAGCDTQLPIPTTSVPTTGQCLKIQTQKRFKRTLIYFNMDTQYAHFRGNPLYQATKR